MARSRRLAGTAASVFPGRRGGAGPKAKFEPVQNSGVVTVSTAALFFPARTAEALAGRSAGRPAGGKRRTRGPAAPGLPARRPLRPQLQPGWSRARSCEPPALRPGRCAVPRAERSALPATFVCCRPSAAWPDSGSTGLWLVDPTVPIALETLGKREVTIISDSSFRAPCSDPFQCCSAKHVSALKIIYQG